MKFPIGFAFNDESKKVEMEPLVQQATVPVKSLVQVYFPERKQTLTYFNDQFDLKRGDFVFVDGKLKETLELIEKHYADLLHGYFSAIVKSDLFRFAIDSHETGSFTL